MEYKGFTYIPSPKTAWDNLSMLEKSEMMKVAVKNGLTDLKSIREKYNEFAGGGYLDWKERANKYKHLDIDNDRTYDYEGWYNENPQRAWDFLNDSPDAHFDDKYKTVYHPTFSTQSKYSGVVDPVFNPNGLVGGTWNKQGTVFTMSPDGYKGPVSMDERAWYLINAEDNGVQLREADGSLPVFDGIPWGGVLPTVTVSGNKFGGGGKKKPAINPKAQRAMQFFINKGLAEHQAAGLVGNLMRESDFNIAATNPYSGAYGLAQWLGPRKVSLFSKYGKNPTFEQQLDFVWDELNSTHKNGLKHLLASRDAAEAARNAMGYYEFSAGPEGAIREMRKWGQDGEGAMQKGINFASQLIGGPVVPFRAETPQWNNIPFTPANPEVFFGNPVTTIQPVVNIEPTRTPMLEYDPKEAEKQEKRDNLNRFNMFLGMLNGSNESVNESAFPFSMFAEGGDIHIKPENRGKFTALKERTGHSATWFKEHGTPAQKKMATFALNARHWKHGLGGNLFEDGGPKKPFTRDDLRGMLQKRRAEAEAVYNGSVTETRTTPNDNAWVDKPLTRRKKNPHLSRRAEEGAKAHAAWEREHPNLAAWGNLAGAIPFAVASVPLGAGIVAGGDALAATAAGQAITSGLAPLYQAATGATIAGAPALAWADAGLTSAFGAHGISQAIEDGGISPMTALEIAPFGRIPGLMWNAAKPTIGRTVTTLQNNYPALFDPYTSWDATLGYHGDNIFNRTIGTVGRRYNWTPKVEIPEFHRRLLADGPETFRMTKDGKFIMSSGRTGDGHDNIVNFATSEAARGHSNHRSLSGVNDFIIPSKVLEGVKFKSIQPSDTFFEVPELAVEPKQVTLVSGNPLTLKYARSLGMRTLSSPRLRHFNSLNQEGISISGKIHEGKTGRFSLDRGVEYENAEDIGKEIQRLTSMRGAPTLKDYAHFENVTGLNSGVIPNTSYNLNNRIDLLGRYGNVRTTPIFNNVIYDPATNIEAIYRNAKTEKGTWDRYYEALEKLPSARQQLARGATGPLYGK